MTTTVKRGAGRKEAAAKRTKHAQQTVPSASDNSADAFAAILSAKKINDLRAMAREAGFEAELMKLPKAGLVDALAERMAGSDAAIAGGAIVWTDRADDPVQPESGPEVVAGFDDLPRELDALSLPELRKLASVRGWSTLAKASKRTIVKTLRDNPDGPPAAAQAKPVADPKPAKRKSKSDGSSSYARRYDIGTPTGSIKPVKTEVPAATAKKVGEGIRHLRSTWSRAKLSRETGVTCKAIHLAELDSCQPDALDKLQDAIKRLSK